MGWLKLEKLTKQINIYLTSTDFRKIEKLAKEQERTLADTTRRLLKGVLKKIK